MSRPLHIHDTLSLPYVQNTLRSQFLSPDVPAWKAERAVECNVLLDVPGSSQHAVLPGFRIRVSLLAPHIKYWSTPKLAAAVITRVLVNEPGVTGVYFDEKGHPMLGSALVSDLKFQDHVVAETRALLATIPK